MRLETCLDKLAGCLGRMTVRKGARRTVPETRQKQRVVQRTCRAFEQEAVEPCQNSKRSGRTDCLSEKVFRGRHGRMLALVVNPPVWLAPTGGVSASRPIFSG